MNDSSVGHSLTRPTSQALRIGEGALAETLAELEAGFVLVSQPAPLSHLEETETARAGLVLEATTLEHEVLDRLAAAAPSDRPIVGIGGGVVMDSAKWLAVRSGAPLILAPTILSVDACVTNSVALRDGGRVTYRGFVEAEAIVLDIGLVRRAPARLNCAGIGDLLSIHTALWDWQAAQRAGQATWDAPVARRAADILDELARVAEEVPHVSEDALRTIITGYAEINDMTVSCGHALMEEGSEHYLGYLLEHQTGRSFVHGELVTLGVIVMSRLQANDPARPLAIAERAQVQWRAERLGISRAELLDALLELRPYVEASGLAYSIANELELREQVVRSLIDEVV